MGWIFRVIIPIFIASSLFGAEHYGYVRSGKKPIPGATVTASMGSYKLVTTTDENGIYVFSIPDKGQWVFTAEMFGFTPAHEELTLVGAASVLDLNLELQAVGIAETPTAGSAPGFQTVDVKEQVDSQAQIEQQVEATATPAAAPSIGGGADVNEAFLVNGSLSGGLQSVQQQNFFDQLDKDQAIATKPKKAKGDLAPGEKRAKKAAKKAKKKKKLADTVNSFGATKEGTQIKGNLLYTFRDGAFDASPYSLSGQPLNKPSYQQSRIGAAAGGPLPGSPQTTFFLNLQVLRSDNPYANFDTVPSAAQRKRRFQSAHRRGTAGALRPDQPPAPGRKHRARQPDRQDRGGTLELHPAAQPAGRCDELPVHRAGAAEYFGFFREAESYAEREKPFQPERQPCKSAAAARHSSSVFRTASTDSAFNPTWAGRTTSDRARSTPSIGRSPATGRTICRTSQMVPTWRQRSAFRGRRRIR